MPKFNYAAAIAAGKSPEEVKAYVDRRNAEGANLDVINMPAASAQQSKQPGLLDRAAGVSNKFLGTLAGLTGLDQGGKSLARLGFQLGHKVAQATGTGDTNQTLPVQQATPKQVLGDVLSLGGTGLNLAAPGGGNLGRTVLANAGAAGLLGTGKDLGDNKSAGQALASGATKAAIAGAVTGGVGLLGKLFNSLTSKLPEAAYKSSLSLPNKTDASALLDEGLTGSREAIKGKVAAALADAEGTIQGAPEMADLVNPGDALKSKQLQQFFADAQTLGTDSPEYSTIKGVLDTKLFNRPGAMPRADLLTLRRAIDRYTSDSAFADKATGVESQTENALADAYRRIIAQDAGDITPQLQREAGLSVLDKELTRYDNAKARGIPGTAGSLLQRTVMAPAIATPIAGAAHKTGQFFGGLSNNLVVGALKRLARIGAVSALGNH